MPLSKFSLPGRTHQPEIGIRSNLKFRLPRKYQDHPHSSTAGFENFESKRKNIDLGEFQSSNTSHVNYYTNIPVKISSFSSKPSKRAFLGGTFENYSLVHEFGYQNGVSSITIDLRDLKKAKIPSSSGEFNFDNLHEVDSQITAKKVRKLTFKGSINSDEFTLVHSSENPFTPVQSNKIFLDAGDGNDSIVLNSSAKKAKINLGDGDDDLTIMGGVKDLKVKGGPGDDNVTWTNILNAKKATFDLGEGTDSITINPLNGTLPDTIIIKLGSGGTERININDTITGDNCYTTIKIVKPGVRTPDNYAIFDIGDRENIYDDSCPGKVYFNGDTSVNKVHADDFYPATNDGRWGNSPILLLGI